MLVDGAWPKDRGDEGLGLAVEDEQGKVLMLAVVAVVARALLLAVGRIVGRVEVEEDPLRDALLARRSR